jgi:hypothetical protein
MFLFHCSLFLVFIFSLAKCVQRKYRCTFVKFHRQTAPVGPGHTIRPGHETLSGPPSPNSVTASPSRAPVYLQQQQPEEDFILGPSPNVVPSMADALYGATPYTFPPLYPTNDIDADNTDYTGKYRAHSELFGSAGSGINTAEASSSNMPNTTGLSPTLYESRPTSSWLGGWGGQQSATDYHHHHHHHHHHHQQQQQQPANPLSSIPSSMNGNHFYLPSVRYA